MPLRPERRLVSIAEARATIAADAAPVTRTERVPLDQLAGRVLAEPIVASTPVPPFARSAMDGYAVIAADTTPAAGGGPVRLRLIDAVYTGRVGSRTCDAGCCIAIATGAPVPAGADAVVIVEQTERDGDEVVIRTSVHAGENVGRAGSDVDAGDTVLQPGAVLTPARAGVIAALGLTEVVVYARPRVAILSTGDEIVLPGMPLAPGQIHDINTTALAGVIREHGGVPMSHAPVADDQARLEQAFEDALDADLVLVSGGSSVGERDYVLGLLERRGTVVFHGIAIKPGKPTIFAMVDGRPVFGMPGNPTSCLSNGYLLVAPLLRRMARLPEPPERVVEARLTRAVSSPPGRHQFYPVRVEAGEAIPAFKGSGDITSMAHANGYIEIEAACERLESGTPVRVTLF